ncbi:MAG TPA: ferritin [Anaerolineae bacterium]|nr:ferritin [Anaerolineae bacterium]
MLGKRIQDAINEQINAELYSAYLYLSMAAYTEAANLAGFAHWMRAQANEEVEHALKFFKYVGERGGRVVLKAIEQPQVEWTSPLNVFEHTLEHERKVTGLINDLYEVALEEKDYASQMLLHWYIEEQVEEESNAEQIVAALKMVDEKPQGLLMVDRQLASRGED